MKNQIKTFIFVFALSTFSLTLFASDKTGEEDLATFANPSDPGSDPGTPINDYVIPMLLLGSILGYRLLKKRKTESVI